MPAFSDLKDQAVNGVASPQVAEAVVRDCWASVTTNRAAAALAAACYRTGFLAPIGWMVLAPVFAKRLMGWLPGFAGMVVRYRLTNRRLMICHGMKAVPVKEIPLNQIKDVVIKDRDDYFLTGDLDIFSTSGSLLATLDGVKEPDSLRHSILQAVSAWGPFLAK